MIVCIAEKPSVARDIANVLGARDRRDGYIEGNGYQVTWTYGHLCCLKEPGEYYPQWQHWSLSQLPMIPPRFGIKLMSADSYKKQFHIIENLIKDAEMVINCGDAGQEGELIQRWVMQKANIKCPVKRLWISSLTEEAIKEGFDNLRPDSDFQSLYEAGLSRAIGDWMLGLNATRLYTMRYGQQGQMLSVGRVQTPTLALIVNRQEEIDNFVPQQVWELKTVYRDTTFSAIIRKSEEELAAEEEKNPKGKKLSPEENIGIDNIQTKEEGEALIESIKDAPFVVQSIQKKKGKELPPRLFDLTSLQVECNKKFGFSADTTLKVIQSLYEKKITTYPRVDTTYLSEDIHPKCHNILNGLRDYSELLTPLRGKPLIKSKKVFDNSKVTDHHAIIPTGQPASGLTDMEKKVFDLVAKRFIAVFYPDCVFNTTIVFGEAKDIPFKTTGKVIVEQGWKVVFSGKQTDEEDTDEDEKVDAEGSLPNFRKGESGTHTPLLGERWTTPPKPFTEATLLRAMETAGKFVDDDNLREALKENGIGRPSTRAAIIETLFRRNYIRKERKSLSPTITGKELIQVIHEDMLKSAELTGLWEKKLREIEKKTYSAKQFLDELKSMLMDIVSSVMNDNTNRRITTVKEDDKGKSKSKANKAKSSSTVKKDSRQPKIKVGDVCPKCGKGKIIQGKKSLGCSQWREGCDFRG